MSKTSATPKKGELTTIALKALTPDDQNANKGTPRGTGMLEESLRKFGAGRSILADKHLRIIAGNKTLEGAAAIGLEGALVVQSDGTRLVVVQRTDLDLDDPVARELALADNRVGEVNLEWDAEALQALHASGQDLSAYFREEELAAILSIVPAFEPVSEDNQPRLDQKAPVTCPGCGLEFIPDQVGKGGETPTVTLHSSMAAHA
jgi:hypothetical protein